MPLTRRDFLGAITAAGYSRVLGANDRIQVGVVGYGLVGVLHAYNLKSQSDVDIVAVCDVYEKRLRQGLAACGTRAKGYGDFRRLLDDQNIQAVVIATPDHWHALMTLMACANGKDVYVEKPMTLFVQEGRWMVNAARRYRRVVQVGSQQRSGEHYRHAFALLQSGHIGKVHSVRLGVFRNVMPDFGSPPDTAPPPGMDYDLWLGPAPLRAYNKNRSLYRFRWFWDYSGGQLTNLGAHDIDVVHWAMNVKGPTAVSSSGGCYALEDNGETPDTQDVLYEYPGFTVVWSLREASTGNNTGEGLEFYGTKASMRLSRNGFAVHPDTKTAPENLIPQIMGHPAGGPQLRTDVKPVPRTSKIEERPPNALHSLPPAHLRNFLDCVKSRQHPAADVEDGHRPATACHLGNISLRLGRKVLWDADKEEIIADREASACLVRPYRKPWDGVLGSLNL